MATEKLSGLSAINHKNSELHPAINLIYEQNWNEFEDVRLTSKTMTVTGCRFKITKYSASGRLRLNSFHALQFLCSFGSFEEVTHNLLKTLCQDVYDSIMRL